MKSAKMLKIGHYDLFHFKLAMKKKLEEPNRSRYHGNMGYIKEEATNKQCTLPV